MYAKGNPKQITAPLPPVYALFTIQKLVAAGIDPTSDVFNVNPPDVPNSKFSENKIVCACSEMASIHASEVKSSFMM